MTIDIKRAWLYAVHPDSKDLCNYQAFYADTKEPVFENTLTLNEYAAAGYRIMTQDEFFDRHDELDGVIVGDWKEETEEQYDYALNVLPPLAFVNGGFFVSEPLTSRIYAFHQRANGHYYTSLQKLSTPRYEIRASLNKFLDERRNQQ